MGYGRLRAYTKIRTILKSCNEEASCKKCEKDIDALGQASFQTAIQCLNTKRSFRNFAPFKSFFSIPFLLLTLLEATRIMFFTVLSKFLGIKYTV